MHTIAAGEPPLSPETIGRAPSNFDAPVPIVAFDELVRRKAAAQAVTAPAPKGTPERLRLVVRLAGGDEVEVATYTVRAEATAQAKELVACLSAAEAAGEWPEIDGRHLRPASIVSVDVVGG
jgi:hypothetical protein